MSSEIGISVIVDNHPRFFCEFVLWALCARDVLKIPKRVYFVGAKPDGLISLAENNDIDVRISTTLIDESPHCNKIIPFLDEEGFENQIVCDTDLFFSKDISHFFNQKKVRLPPNNHAIPPLEFFHTLFKAAGLEQQPEIGTSLFSGPAGRETYAGNVSAGLICIPASLRSHAVKWRERAEWLVENKSLLGSYFGHIDQIAFAISAAEHQLPFSHLPAQSNAVLQLLPQIRTVYGFHLTSGHIPMYKECFNADKTMNAQLINPLLQGVITELNERIREATAILKILPETRDFVGDFMNPGYNRST